MRAASAAQTPASACHTHSSFFPIPPTDADDNDDAERRLWCATPHHHHHHPFGHPTVGGSSAWVWSGLLLSRGGTRRSASP